MKLRTTAPLPLARITAASCRALRGILADIDDTLTRDGQLKACAYSALEHAKDRGLKVVVVTGRPAGWADHIARMWPVDGVIGENGAFYFHMKNGKLRQRFLESAAMRASHRKKLARLAKAILQKVPGSALATDQPYRSCDLAIDYCEDVRRLPAASVQRIVDLFKASGAQAKVSSIHVNGWFGDYNKLLMTRRFFGEVLDTDLAQTEKRYAFFGDSPNDEPMFAFFTHGIGVANARRFLPQMAAQPHWITRREGSDGFAEGVNILLRKRA